MLNTRRSAAARRSPPHFSPDAPLDGEEVLLDTNREACSQRLFSRRRHLLDANNAAAMLQPVAGRETSVEYLVEEHAGDLLIMTNADGTENYKLVVAPPDGISRASWRGQSVRKACHAWLSRRLAGITG